jgi:subtilase family serine protease
MIAVSAPIIIIAEQQDDNWGAHPLHISQLAGPLGISGYSPSQIRTAYNLPSTGGAGTTIAIIIAYDTPSIVDDLTVFSNQFSLPLVNDGNFELHKMANTIAVDRNWSIEACLDVEWSHAIAPDSKILLVEAFSNNRNDMLTAVDYARSRPDVVAISISWGGDEPSNPAYYNSRFTSKYGAVFFSASGDNGSGLVWPATSAKVVAVGGTSLNLKFDGTVISEVGWKDSSGGESKYEPIPSYQTGFGLSGSKRTVPDVSYNADPTFGFAVYFNSTWQKVGGTSAGAPQWAAIHALGLSASNSNLYDKANLSYSSYFRDITSGSNGVYQATVGYDLVTGLGSPLTYNFGTVLQVSPTLGASENSITLKGAGFLAGSSVNLSYLNPETFNWVPIISNLEVSLASTFNFTLNAPDLLQNNLAGDNEPLSDAIVFRSQTNNGSSFDTTIPYTEYRRGLTQVSNAGATGIYGNNTDLTSIGSIQNGKSLDVTGKWFNPGAASILWDGTIELNSVTVDDDGQFEATVEIPISPVGQHTLIIRDKNSDFCISLSTASQIEYEPMTTSSPSLSIAPTSSPSLSPTPKPSPSTSPTNSPLPTPSATPQIPEIPQTPIAGLIFTSILVITIKFKRKTSQKKILRAS